MNHIETFNNLNESRHAKIAVVGDSMLDEYYNVKITRVSPEFPVQVMHSSHWSPSKSLPGGAANVCAQMNHFNVECYLVSLLDHFSLDLFKEMRFSTRYSVVLRNGHIPIKRRFYDGDFPLPRWDIELPNYGESNIEDLRHSIYEQVIHLLEHENIDILILSDYGKGLFDGSLSTDIINECNQRKVPCIVDPKDTQLWKWHGCTIFKPNSGYIKEALKTLHDNYAMQKILRCSHMVVTDSGNGIDVTDYTDKVKTKHIAPSPVKIPHVKSVIGAGDCFCAVLAIGVAHGMPVEDAAEVAFAAGSVYVEAKHNAPITPYQLARWDDPIACKIVTLDKLMKIKETFPKRTWIWTQGIFDKITKSELVKLAECRKLGDKVVVGLNFDGEAASDRAYHLASLHDVDFIVQLSPDVDLNNISGLSDVIFH